MTSAALAGLGLIAFTIAIIIAVTVVIAVTLLGSSWLKEPVPCAQSVAQARRLPVFRRAGSAAWGSCFSFDGHRSELDCSEELET